MQEDKSGIAESFEEKIRENVALQTRIIELESHVAVQGDIIDGLKKDAEKAFNFVEKAKHDRTNLFSLFLEQLSEDEKKALQSALVEKMGLEYKK